MFLRRRWFGFTVYQKTLTERYTEFEVIINVHIFESHETTSPTCIHGHREHKSTTFDVFGRSWTPGLLASTCTLRSVSRRRTRNPNQWNKLISIVYSTQTLSVSLRVKLNFEFYYIFLSSYHPVKRRIGHRSEVKLVGPTTVLPHGVNRLPHVVEPGNCSFHRVSDHIDVYRHRIIVSATHEIKREIKKKGKKSHLDHHSRKWHRKAGSLPLLHNLSESTVRLVRVRSCQISPTSPRVFLFLVSSVPPHSFKLTTVLRVRFSQALFPRDNCARRCLTHRIWPIISSHPWQLQR